MTLTSRAIAAVAREVSVVRGAHAVVVEAAAAHLRQERAPREARLGADVRAIKC
jgi:hypothetical protein